MSDAAADVIKLQEIGREITARVAALDKHGEKSVNLVDSINSLLEQAEVLCGDPEDFAAFKRTYCPKLGQSRTYELLAIKEGRKTLEEIREAGRLRVAKHRASKRDVTESDSVTSDQAKSEPATPEAWSNPVLTEIPYTDELRRLYVATEPVPTVEEFAALKAAAKAEKAEPAPPAPEPNDPQDIDQAAAIGDPLVVYIDDATTNIVASPWFTSKMKPIFEGSIKNDAAKSASALSKFRAACATLLPQMTVDDLSAAGNILSVVSDIEYDVEDAIRKAKAAAEKAKRVKWEAKNPDKAKQKARDQAQDEAMECDKDEAKDAARQNGEAWSDIRDEWIEDWIANNWDKEAEAEFEREFQVDWQTDHGKPWVSTNDSKAAA
jgi:hypothetical protein